jgi:hypothetical protein
MRKILITTVVAFLLFAGCKKSDTGSSLPGEQTTIATQRQCASYEVLQQQLQADPGLAERMNSIERFTRDFINNPNSSRTLPNGTIEIPVVVNVLYKTAAQNISLAQIQSQITVLNQDYAATNSDYSNTPSVFQSVASGDIKVRFVLDQVIRKETKKTSWKTNDAMKKNQQGGIDPTSPATKLNLWVCNLSGGILGYAQFPGGNPATDGVVIDDNAMGNTGTAAAPFDKGRTATHEVGHWLNLRHIWGDANCGNDLVGDTPIHTTSNFGCPAFPDNSSCGGTVHPMMTMNYMDYTDDACMFMFSLGQKSRMQAVFAAGGPRNSFAQP